MNGKFSFLMTSLFVTCLSADIPELRLPFPSPEQWQLTRGYNTEPTHVGRDKYALDFAQAGCESWYKPVLAAAQGNVVFAGWIDGYGNVVDIEHNGEYLTRYAHLACICVTEEELVSSGQELGRCPLRRGFVQISF